jgi:hypothetical protein
MLSIFVFSAELSFTQEAFSRHLLVDSLEMTSLITGAVETGVADVARERFDISMLRGGRQLMRTQNSATSAYLLLVVLPQYFLVEFPVTAGMSALV